MNPSLNSLDLRVWLEHIQKLGELDFCIGAKADLEIGAISQLNVKRENHKALVFDEIPGYNNGYRVITCTTGS